MFQEIYSPVQQINQKPFSNLFVKRDDLIDPYISGNKWRKLKYILEKAKHDGKHHLVTFGGAYSNHLVATAAAASRSGLKSTAFVRGEEVKNEMLLICSLYGMELIFVDRERYKNKPALYSQHYANNQNTYFIGEGGASAEAIRGCAEIINELQETYDHIFVAAGTGTTAAGLLKGIQANNLSTKLHVIPALKGGEFIKEEISNDVEPTAHLILHTEYHFGGYAKTTPQLLNFIRNFTQETGILIDPVYTAKMFYAIHDLAAKSELGYNDKILAVHTGGLLGILGMKDRF